MALVNKINIPTKKESESLINEARTLNNGKWIEHSINTGVAASIIASHTDDLDPDTCYIMGLLHDIGRRFGKMQLSHTIKGYNFMQSLGYSDIARINITHTFPIKDIDIIVAKWDCDESEVLFVKKYLDSIDTYDDYDRLIQLADYLLAQWLYHTRKRMVDIGFRYGVCEKTLIKWKELFKLKEYFDKKIDKNIYRLLPDIDKTTFG